MSLTAFQTLQQSALIHPDWTGVDHYNYLVNDAFLDSVTLEWVRASLSTILGRPVVY